MRTVATALLLLVAISGCATPGAATPSTSPTSPAATPSTAPDRTAERTPFVLASPDEAPGNPPAGEHFRDPEGLYEMTIGTDWVAHHGGLVEGVEVWAVAAHTDDFMPNVNVLTQSVGDMTLEDYSALSVRSAPRLIADFRLLGSRTARGPDGSLLAVLDFSGTSVGRQLRFLGVWTVGDGRAIVATLTTPVGSFDRIRAAIEPYLLTLAAT